MSSPPPPSVVRVLETCLYAEGLEETGEFYERVLGLVPFAHSDGRHVFFRCGQGVLLLFNPLRTREDEGEVPAHGATGAGHVAFAVADQDLDRWRTHLERAGIPVEREVRWPRGGLSIYLRDPAGNSVELTSPQIWGIPET